MKPLIFQLSTFIDLITFQKKKKSPPPMVKLDLKRLPNDAFLKYAHEVCKSVKAAPYPVCKPELQNLSKEIEELEVQMNYWQSKEQRDVSRFMALRNAREKVFQTIRLLYNKSGMFQKKQPSKPFMMPKLPHSKIITTAGMKK